MFYPYRCTEQQLESHMNRIVESGDTVEHVIFKGGRDYVLICRKAAEPMPVRIVWDEESEKCLRAGMRLAAEAAEGFKRRLS